MCSATDNRHGQRVAIKKFMKPFQVSLQYLDNFVALLIFIVSMNVVNFLTLKC